ncbi:DUF5719 family protein [Nesterenkonia ebinurensis]|uniref:DUF5719 family protein n=1 Tax=Nesterenkonia ebinurensis TaxID=2608252 RepID=UPI00123DA368|nr:DUF5719 family protein [Nesterenkonia ebinurensis]
MSSVKKYIRTQRRARRKAQKAQERAVKRQAWHAEETEQTPRAGARHAAATEHPAETRSATRAAAVLVGLGLVAAGIGSAWLHITDPDPQPALLQQPAYAVPAPAVTERLVCPAMPGQPDSLSEQGVLEYAERDSAASAMRSAAIFAAADGRLPGTDWVTLGQEGRGEPEQLIGPEEAGESAGGGLAERHLVTGTRGEGFSPALLEIQPVEGPSPSQAPAAAAEFTYYAEEGAVAGLATTGCTAPQRSQWFLGPETGIGSDSLLTLANPHSRDATVEITTYSEEGETGALGATTLLVPENTVRTVNLAALTERDAQLAVHVQASGAPVTAHLQSAFSAAGSGLGVEQLSPMAALRQEHYAVGVPAGADQSPQLWFYAPGTDPVTVELQVFSTEGQVITETPGVFSLEPGRVSAVGLTGLEPGTYDVAMTTDQPALAAVRSAGTGEEVTVEVELEPETDPWTGEQLEPETEEQQTDPAPDFSWATAGEPIAPGSGALLPEGFSTELRFFATPGQDQAEITYRLFDSQGRASQDLVAEAEGGASVEVPYEELLDRAESADLEDVYAVLVVRTEGEAYGSALSTDGEGRFSIGALHPITPISQHVPFRLDP